jgi:cytochrome c2
MKQLVYVVIALSLVYPLTGQDYRDIYVADKVMVQRTTLDGHSSRMIAVGHPGGFNFAFDAVHCSPTFAWFGGFLDFSGEANGRGGKGSVILGVKRSLGTDPIPFHVGSADELPKQLEFLGYRRDYVTGNPTFLFEVDGVSIEQTLSSRETDQITIDMVFPQASSDSKFYLLDPDIHSRIELGEGLHWRTSGVIEIPARQRKATLTISLKPTNKTFVRKTHQLSGAQIFQNYCNACHSTDGTKLIGPGFRGLLGREQTITRNGRTETLIVDESYIRESIKEPQAAIVKGFEQVPMANFSAILTDDQLELLIEFIRELK